MRGIVVGCDRNQEWLLPWWWGNYSKYNDDPVVFMDYGMSARAAAWCRERGECVPLSTEVVVKGPATGETKAAWERRLGKEFWGSRSGWHKKPFALKASPFELGVWIDLDCHVKGSLEPLFLALGMFDLAIARDEEQNIGHVGLPGEVYYNSGVIAFRKGAAILDQWAELTMKKTDQFPGDQEVLSRAIFLNKPMVLELPFIYNWPHSWGKNEESVIHHYFGGKGKVEILESIGPEGLLFHNPLG